MLKYENKLYTALLVVILVAASVPVFCGYVMEGGMAEQWVTMLQGLVQSRLFLFLRWNGNVRWLWVTLLFLIQVGSLGGAVLLYRYTCSGRVDSLCGVLLYMTMPFRIYLCYDKADISQVVIWMILPFYLWSILHIIDDRRRCLFVPISILLLAALGYVNAVFFPIVAGVTLLAGLITCNVFLSVVALGGFILAVPGLRHFISFILCGETGGGLSIPYESIMPRGYAIGELFCFFRYAENRPGIGAGLLFVLFLLAWSSFVYNRSMLQKRDVFYLAAGLMLLLCSLHFFPWDLVQRVHPALLRMVASFQTPGLFLHFSCFLLILPCAKTMGRLYRESDRYTGIFLVAALFIICIATTFYQCDTYLFSRQPLSLN